MGDAVLSAAQRRQLKGQGTEERKIKTAKCFRGLQERAEAIPLRSKTQYAMYCEVRTLYLLRELAKLECISVQELIRQCLEEGLDKRMSTSHPLKRKRRAASSRKP